MGAPQANKPGSGGLSEAEAARRLQRDGPNLLPQADRRNRWRIIGAVLVEPMLLLLLAAAGVYILLGDPREAAVLGASVVLVIGLTVHQEFKSERALQALRDLSSPRASVLRDGHVHSLAARDLVVGDLIFIAEGDRVPADARLLSDSDLVLDESMLSGESVPVSRSAGDPDGEARIVHASTLVVRGRGTAEVTAVGARTTVGGIGTALRSVRAPRTPMQREMRSTVLLFAALGVGTSVLVTLLYGATRGDWLQAVLAGITLAMANIPEEFPVVLAVFLALGAWRMARHKALVRRPPAIEALGSVTVLCTDKTGTLTENRMSLVELAAGDEHVAPTGALSPRLHALLSCGDAASPAQSLDPMERAIAAAMAQHTSADGPESQGARIREYPFSSETLSTTHVWRPPGAAWLRVCCKGAPEAVATLCGVDAEERAAILREVGAMARRGLRVIATAEGRWDGEPGTLPAAPGGFALEWRGLLGLADPLRQGVREAVDEARQAGVRVVMLTGDHVETARAIAEQAGLARTGEVLLGSALEDLEGAQLYQRARNVDVFARVKPAHKLRLVDSLREGGQVVAMTGDGVNDAPALAAAHVGVAMGGRGTDVAREAASIVLLDDNFVTVVKAIRHGRAIYDNILRAIRYILAVHVPITGLALLPLLVGGPLVLTPLHVVVLEMIIDPAATLVFEREPADPDIMRRPPRAPGQRLLDAKTLLASLAQGGIVLAVVAVLYLVGWERGLEAPQLAAASFTALVAGNLGLIVLNRADAPGQHWWRQSNPAFWTIVVAASSLLVIVIGLDAPSRWFRFAPPPPGFLAAAVLLPLLALGVVEVWRSVRRRPASSLA